MIYSLIFTSTPDVTRSLHGSGQGQSAHTVCLSLRADTAVCFSQLDSVTCEGDHEVWPQAATSVRSHLKPRRHFTVKFVAQSHNHQTLGAAHTCRSTLV